MPGQSAFVEVSVFSAPPPCTLLFTVVLLPLCYLDRQNRSRRDPTSATTVCGIK